MLCLRDSRDHEAWAEFISLCEPLAYRLLRRRGLQDADAHEVMQELFLAVNRSIDRWDSGKDRWSFRGWLRRTARNLVINLLKERVRRVPATGGSDMRTGFVHVYFGTGDSVLRKGWWEAARNREAAPRPLTTAVPRPVHHFSTDESVSYELSRRR